MKASSIKELKEELKTLPSNDLVNMCLKLSKFKLDNKEYLSFLLFEESDLDNFVNQACLEIETMFSEISAPNFFLIKKSVRKILRMVKKYIQYAKDKNTEVELLLFFCEQLIQIRPSIRRDVVLSNMFLRQLQMAHKAWLTLHEDLQYDFEERFEKLESYGV